MKTNELFINDMDGDKIGREFVVVTRDPAKEADAKLASPDGLLLLGPIGKEANRLSRLWHSIAKAENGRFPVDTYLYLSSDIIDWVTGPIDHVKK